MTANTLAHPGLNRFACLTALATLVLICVGGLVTSHEAGMSVPDWPTTYGYNMFLFPVSMWKGGVFYEHLHRLVASTVGLLTWILAVWLWLKEDRRWLRWLGVSAALLVLVLGILGGLRVTRMMSQLGIFHAILAQLFLVLLSAIALFTSKTWRRVSEGVGGRARVWTVLRACLVLNGLVLFQLTVAATMRHQHAGLAIPDFPTAYGSWWPDTRPEAIARYNHLRPEKPAFRPITAFQVRLHLLHRGVALLLLGGVGWLAGWSSSRLGGKSGLTRWLLAWASLMALQAVLGMVTVWSHKAPLIATLHVGFGALTLVVGSLIALAACRLAGGAAMADESPEPSSRNRLHPSANILAPS